MRRTIAASEGFFCAASWYSTTVAFGAEEGEEEDDASDREDEEEEEEEEDDEADAGASEDAAVAAAEEEEKGEEELGAGLSAFSFVAGTASRFDAGCADGFDADLTRRTTAAAGLALAAGDGFDEAFDLALPLGACFGFGFGFGFGADAPLGAPRDHAFAAGAASLAGTAAFFGFAAALERDEALSRLLFERTSRALLPEAGAGCGGGAVLSAAISSAVCATVSEYLKWSFPALPPRPVEVSAPDGIRARGSG